MASSRFRLKPNKEYKEMSKGMLDGYRVVMTDDNRFANVVFTFYDLKVAKQVYESIKEIVCASDRLILHGAGSGSFRFQAFIDTPEDRVELRFKFRGVDEAQSFARLVYTTAKTAEEYFRESDEFDQQCTENGCDDWDDDDETGTPAERVEA